MWTEPNHIPFGLIFMLNCMCLIMIQKILVTLSNDKIAIPYNKLPLSGSPSSHVLSYVMSEL